MACLAADERRDERRDEPPLTLELASESLEPERLEEDEEEPATAAAAGVGVLERVGATTPSKAMRRAPPGFDPWLSDAERMRPVEYIAAAVVVPPRVLFCIAAAVVVLPISVALMLLATLLSDGTLSRPAVRYVLVLPIRICCRLALLGAGFWWIHTDGDASARAPIVVSNHVSVADVLWFVWALAPAFLAKKEALRIPYVGAAARTLGCVFVDRTSAESRNAARDGIAARAASADASPPLVIFPEGTTTSGLSLLVWEKGAFSPGYPVSPVAIAYPKGQRKPDALFSIETLLAIVRPANWMQVTFLPRYTPNVEERTQPALFADGVRCAVANALDLPLSECTFRAGLHRHRRERPPALPDAEALRLLRAAPGPLPWRD